MKTEPKERPIIFSGEMVRAIIDERKTQTRRIMKVQPPGEGFQLSRLIESSDRADRKNKGKLHWIKRSENGLRIVESHNVYFNCPYGKVGDRLWVRETFWQAGDWLQSHPEDDEYKVWSGSCRIFYSADGLPPNEPNRSFPNGLLHGCSAADPHTIWRSRPSIHMPRRASRILLEITGVRVERLNDISESDAQSEGCALECMTPTGDDNGSAIWGPGGFCALWESIKGKGSWDLNPWVWVIEFKVLEIKR